MTRYRFAAAVAASLCAAPLAHATPATLVSGQTLSLPLTEESDGPSLKLTVASAAYKGSAYQGVAPVGGETRDERKARGDEMVLDNIEGRNLVKFVRFVADDLRGHYAGAHAPVAVSAAFSDRLKVNGGALTGDALKAGLTLGFGESATTPLIFVSHLELTVDGPGGRQVLTCDAEEPGRVPKPPAGLIPMMMAKKQDHTHDHDELDRMEEAGRKACYAQLSSKLAPAPAAAPSPAASAPAPAAAPATGDAKPAEAPPA
jgi:hypothetical protein